MKTISIVLASLSCCLSAAPVFAANGNAPLTVTGLQTTDPDTIRVSYADLSLINATEAAVLHARVKQATRQKCDALYAGSFLSMSWACRDIAMAAAKPQIAAAIERAGAGQNLAGRAVVLHFARR